MKKIFVLSLLAVLAFSACQEDDNPQPAEDNLLNYDGPNLTGPQLVAADYEAAARFPASFMQEYQGRQLQEVRWFMGLAPARCEVRVYGPGVNNEPGSLLFSEEVDVSQSLRVPGWNAYRLGQPLTLDGDEIWISIAFTHSAAQQSIGCDAGDNPNPNGDWLFSTTDNQWRTFTDRTGDRINWNIRGVVAE